MKLGLRLFLGFFLIVGLSAWLLLTLVIDEVKPVVRQVSEDNLVEISQLLAAMVAPQFAQNQRIPEDLVLAFNTLISHSLRAPIWQQQKTQLSMRVYITNAQGIVKFDSHARDEGKDYSRWNDVYLTLRGQYGVRTSRSDPADEFSSVMHVAAPIRDRDRIIGVLTVAVPNKSHEPYLLAAQRHLKAYGALMVAISLLIGLFTTWWLVSSLRKISVFAEKIHQQPGLKAPQFAQGTELERLMQSLQSMREALDGKNYIEEYVHALTHELKSPLAAIQAAHELLQDESLPPADRQRFLSNIEAQCRRMRMLIDKLLMLAKAEQLRALTALESIDVVNAVRAQFEAMQPRLQQKSLSIIWRHNETMSVPTEVFWFNLGIGNLIENAVNHATPNSTLSVTVQKTALGFGEFAISNQGEHIPDYALARLGERFYSLTRGDGQRGSGLGLRLVREIARLHGGKLHIENISDGVKATLTFALH